MCSCVYVFMCVCVYVCMCLCVHVCMCVCVHVCMCLCVHVCMCSCVHVFMCACVHVFMCACVHVHEQSNRLKMITHNPQSARGIPLLRRIHVNLRAEHPRICRIGCFQHPGEQQAASAIPHTHARVDSIFAHVHSLTPSS